MARHSDIKPVFVQASTLDGKGRQVVTTGTFQKNLEAINQLDPSAM